MPKMYVGIYIHIFMCIYIYMYMHYLLGNCIVLDMYEPIHVCSYTNTNSAIYYIMQGYVYIHVYSHTSIPVKGVSYAHAGVFVGFYRLPVQVSAFASSALPVFLLFLSADL